MCAGCCLARVRGLLRSLGQIGQVRAPALGPVGVNKPWCQQVEGGQTDPGHAFFGEHVSLERMADMPVQHGHTQPHGGLAEAP